MTEYKRYMGKSYMVLRTDAAEMGYVCPMLVKNRIAGLLSVQMAEADESIQFWYDISGRQTLEDWMKIKSAGSVFLKRFLASLAKTLQSTGGYLLPEGGISLLPERIFVDTDEIVFCYTPFEKKDFEESLCGFMEYYIAHMQHENRADAQKCYEVYEKCQQKNTDLEEVMKTLFEIEEETQRKMPVQEATEESSASIKEKEKSPLFGKGRLMERKFSFRKKHMPAQEYFFAPEEDEERLSNPTVFLGSETDRIFGEFKYEGEGNEMNLKINADVFLIGSQRGETDGVITDDTVSRIHARVTREADEYYLEDMNSTNGTYQNGKRLNYKEKVRLEKNDRIVFAKESYRFV